MCTGAEIGALALTAAGTGYQAYTQDQAAKNQDRAAAQGIMRQAQLQKEAGAKVAQNVQQLQASNPEDIKKTTERDLLAAIQKNSAGTNAVSPIAGASQRYAEDVSGVQKNTMDFSKQLAKTQAAISAPGMQRLNEGASQSRLASQLALLGDQSQGQDALTRTQIAGIAPNPWAMALGSAAQAGGSAYASKVKPIKPKLSSGTLVDTVPASSSGGVYG